MLILFALLICGCLLIRVLRNVKKYKGTTYIQMVGEHCSCKAISSVVTNKEEIYNREITCQVVMMVLPGFVSGCVHCLCMVCKDIWETWSERVECVGYVICYVSVWSIYYAFYWTIRKEYDERECKEGEHEVEVEKGNDNIKEFLVKRYKEMQFKGLKGKINTFMTSPPNTRHDSFIINEDNVY